MPACNEAMAKYAALYKGFNAALGNARMQYYKRN